MASAELAVPVFRQRLTERIELDGASASFDQGFGAHRPIRSVWSVADQERVDDRDMAQMVSSKCLFLVTGIISRKRVLLLQQSK